MTGGAGSQHLAVVDLAAAPATGYVTGVTLGGAGDMFGTLASRTDAVMAGRTTAGHVGVIEHRAAPAGGGVAVVAGVVAIDVAR